MPRWFQFVLAWGVAIQVSAQYRPIETPNEWTFSVATAAYSPDEPSQKLGDFQPGITVEVLEATGPDAEKWRVAFKRYGQPDIISLIDAPDLAASNPEEFARIQPLIDGFPQLKSLLEAPHPWPESRIALAEQVFGGSDTYTIESGTADNPVVLTANEKAADSLEFWGIEPLSAFVDFTRPESPKVVIEIWDKGDAYHSKVNPSKAKQQIQESLEAIQNVFKTRHKDPGADSASSRITAVRMKETAFLLPNDLRVSLRYDYGEYLLIVIESIRKLEALTPPAYDPDHFKETIAARVKTSEAGNLYIQGIPMIDQGAKGYCAVATLARVLQYYGYAVDVHAMADLAKTEAQFSEYDSGGTFHDDIIQAMRRICNSTPFRLDRIERERPDAIQAVIEQGIPIIWFVPGHARLLIGLNPETHEIVFSDSYGAEHQYETATWDYFVNVNREMWTLTPR